MICFKVWKRDQKNNFIFARTAVKAVEIGEKRWGRDFFGLTVKISKERKPKRLMRTHGRISRNEQGVVVNIAGEAVY